MLHCPGTRYTLAASDDVIAIDDTVLRAAHQYIILHMCMCLIRSSPAATGVLDKVFLMQLQECRSGTALEALTCDLQKASSASFLLPGWTSRELTAGVMRAYSMTAVTSSMSASCSPMLSTKPSSTSCSIAFQAACSHRLTSGNS